MPGYYCDNGKANSFIFKTLFYSVESRSGVGQAIAPDDLSSGEESPGSIGQSAR